MNNLYEVLEICLQELERGADIETILSRYPEFADELRPILEGSINARSMAIIGPSAEVVRRNRAKVLQHAAQMREAQARPSRRLLLVSLRRLAVTLVVVAALFVSGTGLVRAASTTLPGDNLYPVKRSWEDVLLLLTFDPQQRQALEVEHENERLYEVRELFAEGRAAEVDFAGLVTKQTGNEWVIGGFPVIVSPQTEVRNGSVVVGSAVRVKGHAQDNKIIAERIELLAPGAVLPDEIEMETENHEGPNQQGEDNSGKGSEGETPKIEETKAPEVESGQKKESFEESNSGSGSNDGGGSHDSGGDDHSSGESSADGSSHSGSDDSGGGGDHSSSDGGDG